MEPHKGKPTHQRKRLHGAAVQQLPFPSGICVSKFANGKCIRHRQGPGKSDVNPVAILNLVSGLGVTGIVLDLLLHEDVAKRDRRRKRKCWPGEVGT